MRPIPGLCDRCGQRYHLKDLKEEFLLGRPTGVVVCKQCHDESHPQLDTRNVRTSDKQTVPDAQSDAGELAESRRLHGFSPFVGGEATGFVGMKMGRVTVTTE